MKFCCWKDLAAPTSPFGQIACCGHAIYLLHHWQVQRGRSSLPRHAASVPTQSCIVSVIDEHGLPRKVVAHLTMIRPRVLVTVSVKAALMTEV